MSKSGDIRGFFKKKTSQASSATGAAAFSYTNSVFEVGPHPPDEQTRRISPPAPPSQVLLDLPSSPITPQKKNKPKHKFDMKTLLSHARKDNETEKSARRAEEAKAQAEKDLEPEPDANKMAGEFFSDDEVKGEKLAMALDRTTGDESRPRAYFFGLDEAPRSPPRRQFPRKAVKANPWSILQDASSRRQTIIHGLPTILARRGKELPDELYLWILDEICVEKDLQLRNQYINLATTCLDDMRRLVDEKQLYNMLEKLGGQKHSTIDDKFELSPGLQAPYPSRDWSQLRYFLELLQVMAPNLAHENKMGAIKMLIRLSLDPVISTVAGLQVAYSKAMLALVSALPAPEDQWTNCCENICNYLYTRVDAASQRNMAITLLPASTPRMVELQRRLASEALLGEPNLGARHPDKSVTAQDLFSRLSEPDFQITSSTDFGELNALISLLDITIHDGSHLYRARLFPSVSRTSASSSSTLAPMPTPSSLASPSTTPSPASEAEARAQYDMDVDGLLRRLKVMHDKISDNTLVVKKEAKAAMDGLMKRLNHTVRSRPQPKEDIFEGILVSSKKDNADLPRQKDFMKKWTAAKAARAAE
ncbi:hypothetical protein BKA67DRAFT_425620 [Truncatella angustata]|uniref:Uncharacterized protein n=1 Tax=Truncatella angustata TaxID=152316 RepID=A0A9P8UA82_9PEZI|nr:uncharacterized protein BKA67DRAFT_425620 [Truncatella angustata]KAH6647074.1 hypothetical protein BKA67DRAFT_425620 [Truncatella angustata]